VGGGGWDNDLIIQSQKINELGAPQPSHLAHHRKQRLSSEGYCSSRIDRSKRFLGRQRLHDHLLELAYRFRDRWPEHEVYVARIDAVSEAGELPEP